MSDVVEKPALNGVNTPTLLATIKASCGKAESRGIPKRVLM